MHSNLIAPDAALNLWLGKPAPRYTSYPPAPFFNDGVTARDYAKSLGALAALDDVSLYLHIPFCRSLCLYCGCNTLVTQRSERVTGYLALLQREIKLIAALSGKRRVRQLHFGGGTPNMLSAEDIRALFMCLRQAFDFDSIAEIAMELDPRQVTSAQAQALAECGVNRVSLGVQDFDDAVQEAIHRPQPYAQVAEVCGWLREAGIRRINLDLLYGLPRQTPETIGETARLVGSLDPERVAIFSYAHVPSIKKHQMALEAFGLPDVEQRLIMEQTARDALKSYGYLEIGIDHFAKPDDPLTRAMVEGRLRRGFQGYCEDTTPTLIGLGASSISQTVDGYFQNEHDERDYGGALSAGRIPVRRGCLLSSVDRVRRAVIERLMCDFVCDIGAVCRAYGEDVALFADDLARLRPYVDVGLVAQEGLVVRLTSPHRMAVRVICKVFDDYSRHSSALSSKTA